MLGHNRREVKMLELLLLIAGLVIAFIYFSRPLNETEIYNLAIKRRKNAINEYYDFDIKEYYVAPEVRKKIKPTGLFYSLSPPISLESFPSIAAALLKYKKHEWVILGFEKDGYVEELWINKGHDAMSANLELDLSTLVETIVEKHYTSVLFLHNHPNPDPNRYSTRDPSEADLIFANQLKDLIVPQGVNFLAFVCERGRHHEFLRSISRCFMPLENFLKEIQQETRESTRWKNFELRMELLIDKH